ncbi:MAG: sensor histidine kinase [Candidatus Eiseniibacteriota bacterium]
MAYPDPDVHRWLEGLLKTTDVMDHTVNQLMGTAAGSGPKLSRDRVDLAHLVRRAAYFYDRIAARKQIRITAMPEGPMPEVIGDRLAIAAALDNLLSNAVKFSKPGSTVTLDIREEPGRLVCSVIDEGPGLSAEDQKKLFQRGAVLTAKPTGGEPSTGYGLAVAKDLIEKQGGRIWCESQLGKGATFSFDLPSAPAAAPAV